ncbi:hypothetical protein DICVIV_09998 [Dictyocaulus viviparus]|uniref:MICOS complex subunit MIC60 n=1 Tax=Dictyocaulus viviparus TaxID=29172 RepID=A0A0D8XH41_DICVI|nr:hypothetical protein DICVIV_09998 [Dictyocaulus viviparus]
MKWWSKVDFSESNFYGAFFHILSLSMAVCALLSSEWILIEEPVSNATANTELFFDVSHSEHCTNIGCRDFWRPARFGGFLDRKGRTHIAFHSNERVLLDCVTPMVANLFYVLIAFCFVITLTSLLSFIMNLLPPPNGFLQWLRRNTIFEMCNMLLTLCVCVVALIVQCEVARVRPNCDVSLGGGVFMVCLAGMMSFFAATSTLRHSTKMSRLRRIDNQRLLCARSLRSWRDSARRSDDVLPIVDFERYLDSSSFSDPGLIQSNPKEYAKVSKNMGAENMQTSVIRFFWKICLDLSMLRIGAVRFQNRFSISGLKSVRMHGTQSTPTSGSIPSKSSRLKRKVLFTIGAFVSVTGGVVAYAYVDPSFRRKVEKAVPHSRSIFEAILGSSSFSIAKQQIADARDQIISVLPKKKHEEVLPPLTKIPFSEPKERSLVHVDPVDIKMPHDPAANFQNSQDMSKNEELESSLLSAIHSAETQVRIATKAKFETIEAINEHTRLVKLTVDEPQKADWEKVTSALQHAESLAHRDRVAEVEGRNSIHSLRKVIAQGKDNLSTSRNPLLLNATETANKLSHELDELDGLVSKARQESAILNQYKDLIERSRNQFALEMKSILPNVDINAKAKKLTEEELNALIAHAHLKVDHLRRQLSEQQVREEQNIARAIADQREADERIAAERMALELEDLKRQLDVEIEKAVMENRSSWEIEMEEQLRRTTAAHSEHLEQVIRTQRQLFEIEHSQKVEEAIKLERDIHSRQVGAALSRLEGIEYALNNRVALDSENRRAKQFWIACHNLIESIKYGNKAGDDLEKRRFPLEKSLSLLKQV